MVNGQQNPTVNPFVNDDQRKACYAKNDPNWDCKEWDEHGKTDNQLALLWNQLVNNAEQPRHPKLGHYQGMAHTAAKKGWEDHDSPNGPRKLNTPTTVGPDAVTEELDEPEVTDSLGEDPRDDGRNIDALKRQPGAATANADGKCPECGGPMVGGECQRCGYTANCSMGGKTMNGPYDFSPSTPHDASKGAAAASVMHGQASSDPEAPGAREHALQALDHAASDNPKKASLFHGRAAEAHEMAATEARKGKDMAGADNHDQAAALHRKAASMHQATMNARTKEIETMTRQQKIAKLAVNCDCQKSRAALNHLSDDVLDLLLKNPTKNILVANAAPDSSFSDVKGGGKGVRAGVDDDDPNPKVASEDLNPGEDQKPIGNADQVCNALFGLPAAAVKSALQFTANAELKEKRQLIRRLTANIADPERKKARAAKLLALNLDELQDMAELLPPPMINQEPIYNGYQRFSQLTDMSFLESPAVNAGASDDLLDTPTINYADEN